jgi:hypothetical protein
MFIKVINGEVVGGPISGTAYNTGTQLICSLESATPAELAALDLMPLEEFKPKLDVAYQELGTPFYEVTAEKVTMSYPVIDVPPKFERYIQSRLDHFAKSLDFDNALEAALYVTSPNEVWRAQAQGIVDLATETWLAFYDNRQLTTWAELVKKLPVLKLKPIVAAVVVEPPPPPIPPVPGG